MATLTTHGITVSVETSFQPNYSVPYSQEYIFSYCITIENKSGNTIKLQRRHWEITEVWGHKRFVEGEGVIGETPVLRPGETYQYISMCNLRHELGKMEGYYTFRNLETGTLFTVNIPSFTLATPTVLS
jgi:ApaG protein